MSEWYDDYDLDSYLRGMDGPSLAGFHKLNKVFKLRPQGAASKKEVAMSNTIKGKVTEVKVNPANGRHAYMVDGQWYSTFVNDKTSAEAAKVLGEIQAGYDVELAFTENKGFFNIDGIISYAPGEPGEAAEQPKPAKSGFTKKPWSGGGKPAGSGWKPEDKRPSVVSFATAYAKDMIIELLKGDDLASQDPRERAKFVEDNWLPLADKVLVHMLAKLKELGYSWPKSE